MRFEKLVIEGFKRFKEPFEYTFNEERPFNYLSGENGKGKTSIIEALRWVLTGKLPDEPINKDSSYCFVALYFDEEQSISRKLSKGSSSMRTEVRVNGKVTSAKSTLDFLSSLLNCDAENLDICTSSEVLREMFKGELGKFLSKYIPASLTLKKLSEITPITDEEYKVLSKYLTATFDLEGLSSLYSIFYGLRKDLNAKLNTKKAQLDATVIDTVPTRTEVVVSTFLDAAKASEKDYLNYLSNYEKYEKSLSEYNNRLAKLKELKDRFAKDDSTAIDSAAKKSLEEQKAATMQSVMSNDKTISVLTANIKGFESILSKLSEKKCVICDSIECTTDKSCAIKTYEDQITTAQAEIDRLKKENETLCEKIIDITNKINMLDVQQADWENKQNLDKQIKMMESVLGDKPVEPEKVVKASEERITALTKELENIKKYAFYKELLADIEKISQEASLYDSLVKKLSPKGEITTTVLGYYSDLLSDEITEIADIVGYKISYLPENGLKVICQPGKDKKPVDFFALSQGEQLITSILVQHLINILTENVILIIDDCNHLDDENAKKVKTLIETIESDYSLILAAGIKELS